VELKNTMYSSGGKESMDMYVTEESVPSPVEEGLGSLHLS